MTTRTVTEYSEPDRYVERTGSETSGISIALISFVGLVVIAVAALVVLHVTLGVA